MSKTVTTCCAALAVAFLCAGQASAAMAPAVPSVASSLQKVDCAVGFKLGPAGACIIGTPDPVEHDRVIERRSSDEGCETRSVKRTDTDGTSETRTTSNCN
jgi:hypothetical protein